MKNSKHTKRALLASVLSMMLCIAMLVGSTFAWFTDSVTSGQNKIVAGNLDIELEYSKDCKNWENVQDATELFQKDARWEPGHAEVVYLRINNLGSLALKYKFALNIDSETQGTNVEDNKFSLSDYLKYGVVEGQQTAFADRAAAIGAVKSPIDLTAYSKEGKMTAGSKEQYLAIVVYMPTEVGNEANYRGRTAPSITLSLSLIAAQDTVESDSFGKDYDAGAEYPVVTQSDFEEALRQVQAGDDLKLPAGTFKMLEGDYEIPEGVSIIGKKVNSNEEKGTKIWVDHGNTPSSSGLLLARDNVTLSNVELVHSVNSPNEKTGFVRITGNNVTLDNVTINTKNSNLASPIVISNTSADNVITIKNCKIFSKNARAIYILDGANGTVNIEKCEVTGLYPISINSASSQELILNVTDSRLNGWTSYGNIKSANFTNTEFGKGRKDYQFMRPYANTTFTNCTFDEGYMVGAGAIGKTYTFTNCNVAGKLLTAENVESLLLDMSDSDGTNLKGCTVVVDGVSMTPGASAAP